MIQQNTWLDTYGNKFLGQGLVERQYLKKNTQAL